MARKGADVTGIDLATKSLRVAQLHALETGTPHIQYREISVEALAEEQPSSFDVVTCMEMLEHVPDPHSVVQACSQLVKPGGWVFFSTLHRNAKAFMLAIVGAEYLLNMLPRGTHEYAKMIKPSELASSCRAAGLDVLHTKGLEYNPVTRRYWLSADTSVVLFDLDGTLIDSAPDLGAPADKMRTDRGLSSYPLDLYRPMAGAGARGMLAQAFGMNPEHPDFPGMREEFFVNYERRMTVSTSIFDGV
eukprot:gene13882-13668_t